jgi:transcriptional regulator with XRE-family HTH domain
MMIGGTRLRERDEIFDPGKLREARAKQGVSQRMLAGRTGLSRSLIAEVETGKRPPTIGQAELMARALGVPVQALRGVL